MSGDSDWLDEFMDTVYTTTAKALGVPGKSIEAIAEGGTDQDIANTTLESYSGTAGYFGLPERAVRGLPPKADAVSMRAYSPDSVTFTLNGVKTALNFDTEPEQVDELTLDSPHIVDALGAINKHRALCAQRPLNPRRPYGQAQPWTPEDVLIEARAIGGKDDA